MSLDRPPELALRTTFIDDVATVIAEGEIDLLTSVRFDREIEALLAVAPLPRTIRVDLDSVGFIDSSGVAILLKARRRAIEAGVRFTVTSVSPGIARLFDITGLASLLIEPPR
jgi:anti-anti-sigma factor